MPPLPISTRRLIPAHAGKTRQGSTACRREPAHPRSRGENWRTPWIRLAVRGSSPLTRGKLVDRRNRRGVGRLIPAHAGKTSMSRTTARFAPAHPRSRGENYTLISRVRVRTGSSPLTRGKRPSLLAVPLLPRLIPAHAGKTVGKSVSARLLRAHPRSRGENFPVFGRLPLRTGSSPLTRGKPSFGGDGLGVDRLIPAHAGKTWRSCLPRSRCAAHPRSRGENIWGSPTAGTYKGSSPLTRGKLEDHAKLNSARRLIPAHAGKTRASHPARRGPPGSSPLTRGKPLYEYWFAVS